MSFSLRSRYPPGVCPPCPVLSKDRTAEVKQAIASAGVVAPTESRRTVRQDSIPPQQASLQNMLLRLAKDNDAESIRTLVEQHQLTANFGNSMGQTALHVAAIWNSTAAGTALIDLGADVNARNDLGGGTPLHMAAGRGRVEFCELLLANGADPTLQLTDGRLAAEMVEGVRSLANRLLDAAMQWCAGRTEPSFVLSSSLNNQSGENISAVPSKFASKIETSDVSSDEDNQKIAEWRKVHTIHSLFRECCNWRYAKAESPSEKLCLSISLSTEC